MSRTDDFQDKRWWALILLAAAQFVVVKVMTPPAQTAAEREAYERMKREFTFNPRAGWEDT